METPAPPWLPESVARTYPGWVQRKAVTLCKRDQKRGGSGNVQDYRLAIHNAVVASAGLDHWTGEPLDWHLIGSYDPKQADAAGAEHKRRFALLPTPSQPTGSPEPAFVICAWRTNDARHDMTPEELLEFCCRVVAHAERISAPAGGD
jgi:hypothetical protein